MKIKITYIPTPIKMIPVTIKRVIDIENKLIILKVLKCGKGSKA